MLCFPRMPSSSPGFPPGKSPFHVKGVVYRNFFDYMEEKLPDGRAQVLGAIDDEGLRSYVAQPFLAGSYYDVVPTVALCETGASLLHQPFTTFVREFSSRAAERDTTGIYRMLLKLVSPQLVMERTPAAARQYFDFVEATVEKLGPRSYRTGARGIPEMLAPFYMLVTEAFLTHALELAGAKRPLTRWLPRRPDGVREGVPLSALQREVSWQ
jgi:uncharacterized protein (TIGR02265 family)